MPLTGMFPCPYPNEERQYPWVLPVAPGAGECVKICQEVEMFFIQEMAFFYMLLKAAFMVKHDNHMKY